MVVSDDFAPRFSKTARACFSARAAAGAAASPTRRRRPTRVDLWNYKDPQMQPMQQVRAQQDRNRNYRAVVHLADKRFVQLATPICRTSIRARIRRVRSAPRPPVPAGNVVGPDYNDIYLVDMKTGKRKKILEHWRRRATLSPGGKYVLYFDESKATGSPIASPTAPASTSPRSSGLKFRHEGHDTPDLPPAPTARRAGRTATSRCCSTTSSTSGRSRPDGSGARMVTNGEGRKQQIVFRYRALDPEQRAIPVDKPLLLSANEDTHRGQRLLPRQSDRQRPRRRSS